jgi:aminopeptidase N
VASASLFAADSYNSYYHKGALYLIDLEEKIGSELMRQLLSSCVEKGINTTELFLQELEYLTNKDNRNFFEDLLKN